MAALVAGLGRGSNVLGRGGEGSRIHNGISHVRLGRSGGAKTARKANGYGRTDGRTDGRTNGRTDGRTENTTKSVAINWAGAVMQEPLAKFQKTDGRTDTVTYRVT